LKYIDLSKHISDLNLENEYEKEWYFEFNKYISSLSEEEQVTIRGLKERIRLI
jgi:hypothetical protein